LETVSFHCTACGKCCNSAPLASLPELFHHENLFVGGLAIRRVKRLRGGDRLSLAAGSVDVSAEDAEQGRDLADMALFNGPDPYDFSIMAQAVDYESLGRCPALGEDQRCLIHDNRKPAVCSMVPFEALYPDGLQGWVLLNRTMEENCIVSGQRDGYPVVVSGRRVASEDYRHAIARRRQDLQCEKQRWGDAVFSLLRQDLFSNPAAAARIPGAGLLSLSIAPVLLVLAGLSEPCRDRCLRYIDSQTTLIDHKVKQAISRKSALDKPMTRQFRSFKEAYLKVRPELQAVRRFQPSHFAGEERLAEWERDLGV
jgi:Fe-S-cluster containining protein